MARSRIFRRRKRVELVTPEGNKIEVFEKNLKSFTKHITQGNFTEVTIRVEDEGVVCEYITPTRSGKMILQNIKGK